MEAWPACDRPASIIPALHHLAVFTAPNTPRDDSFTLVSSTDSRIKPLDDRGNLVVNYGALDHRATVTFAGRNNRLVAEGEVRLDKPTIRFQGDDGEVIIGAAVQETHLNLDLVVADGASIRIGAGVTSEKSLRITTAPGAKVVIGDDSHIGARVVVNADDALLLGPGEGERRHDVTIGDHVWLLRGVEVRAGARIGDGAVLELVPVVDDEVPEGQLVRGLPATPVRAITWDRSQLPK
jgi:acetyltransferase-like isoleucine patch superfamily enzyme